jgi:hypothetical protein
MKSIFTLSLLLFFVSLQAQTFERTLPKYKLKDADLVLFSFGMDKPVLIGKVDKKGNLSVDISEAKLPELTSEEKSMFFGDLRFVFSVSCGDWEAFGSKGEIPAQKGGYISISAKNEYSGVIFLVSDEALIPWLEDEGYNNAVTGSFYGIIYVAEDVSLDLSCKTNNFADEEKEVEVHYTFDIDLKKGFNWVQYTIEEVYETDPNIRASFPSKMKISNLQDPGQVKWIPKYFF